MLPVVAVPPTAGVPSSSSRRAAGCLTGVPPLFSKFFWPRLIGFASSFLFPPLFSKVVWPCLIGFASWGMVRPGWGTPVKRPPGRRLLKGGPPRFSKKMALSNWFCLLGGSALAGGPPLSSQRAADCLKGVPPSLDFQKLFGTV